MRYPASEKLEIIQLVERSNLSVSRTLAQLGIPKSTFYDWYRRYDEGGLDALEDKKPHPTRVWNQLPNETREAIVELALGSVSFTNPVNGSVGCLAMSTFTPKCFYL